MARIAFITNPFKSHEPDTVVPFAGGLSIRGWLAQHFPGFREFDRATVCTVNGRAKMRTEWLEYIIGPEDDVRFTTCPGTFVQAIYAIITILSVASVVIATRAKPVVPANLQTTAQPDSVFTLRGRTNQNKLGMPIEVRYGRTRIWPSQAAQSYNKYIDNDQWLYLLLSFGQGKFDIEPGMIEDTPIANFPDVTVEIYAPGETVTLFPDNVITSAEVGQLELKGPNEGGGTNWIEDSPGDPDADPPIAATGHYAYVSAGPFIANPAGTGANYIEVDLVFPRGLYLSNQAGGLDKVLVSVLVEVQEIDNAGNAVGSWFSLPLFTKELATVQAQRFTVGLDFPEGRYQVRCTRTTNKNTDSRAGNVVIWEALRAFLPSTVDYGNVTLVAIKARASNNLNDSSAVRFNWWATRKLFKYILGMWSLEEMPTRSIAWAFTDAIKNQDYGGRYDDSYIDLDKALELDALWESRGEYFDGQFDTQGSLWEVLRTILLIGRSVPMLDGSRITIVRDVPRSVPSSLYNQENIVRGSWSRELKLVDSTPYDGVLVTYADPTTFLPATVLCTLTGEVGNYPDQVTLIGCKDRQLAFRLGMYLRARARWQRSQCTFRTPLEGNIPSYLDYVGISYDVPRWGTGGLVLASTGSVTVGVLTAHTLTLSEPVTFDGVSTYQILLRKRNGSVAGPFVATAGVDEYHVTLSCFGQEYDNYVFDRTEELPIFLFGKSNLWGKGHSIAGIAPSDGDEVELQCVVYDDRVFQYDLAEPPQNDNPPGGSLPPPVRIPQVRGLVVQRSPNVPNEVIASWQPLQAGGISYLCQLSYDGTVWGATIETTDTDTKFQVLPKKIYVRVSAKAATGGQGEWAYWVGQAPIEDTDTTIDLGATPNPVTSVAITAGFKSNWLTWTNPTNCQIKNVHIYASLTGTPPGAPTFTVDNKTTAYSHDGLANNQAWNYWFKVESVGGRFSTLAGPYASTTAVGIYLGDLLGSNLVPPEIVSVMPTSGNFQGRMVFLTTTDGSFAANKLYRWTSASVTTGTAFWTAAVPAVDITGQLTDAQIADLATAKLTGQITTTQITDSAISTPKLAAGSVTTAKLVANAVTANEIAADAVTSAKILAGSVTTAKLAANSVTTNELAADSVVAGKIAAAAITATAIGANQVITNTANIADAIITDAKIASLSATKITAGTIAAAVSISSGGSLSCGTGFAGFTVNTSHLVYGNIVMEPIPSVSGTQLTNTSGTHSVNIGSSVVAGVNSASITIGNSTNGAAIDLFSTGLIRTNRALEVTSAGSVTFDVECTAVSFNATSLRALKRNIRDLVGGVELVKALRPRHFVWRQGPKANRKDVGFIAEEIFDVMPQLAGFSKGVLHGVDYGKISVINTLALQELIARVEKLENGVRI